MYDMPSCNKNRSPWYFWLVPYTFTLYPLPLPSKYHLIHSIFQLICFIKSSPWAYYVSIVNFPPLCFFYISNILFSVSNFVICYCGMIACDKVIFFFTSVFSTNCKWWWRNCLGCRFLSICYYGCGVIICWRFCYPLYILTTYSIFLANFPFQSLKDVNSWVWWWI